MIFLFLLLCVESQILIWNTQAICELPCIRTWNLEKVEILNNHGMSYFINEIDSYLRFSPTDVLSSSSGMQFLTFHENNGSDHWNASFVIKSAKFPFMFWDYEFKTVEIDLRRFRVQIAEVPDFWSWSFWLSHFKKPIFKLIDGSDETILITDGDFYVSGRALYETSRNVNQRNCSTNAVELEIPNLQKRK